MAIAFSRRGRMAAWAAAVVLAGAPAGWAAEMTPAELQAEIQNLKSKVAQLEAQNNENWMTAERSSQIKALVAEVIADAGTRDATGAMAGYHDGFFIQSPDDKFKLKIGGLIQFRYSFATHSFAAGGRGNASGFGLRRAKLEFEGHVFDPALTYKVETEFESGDDTGTFAVDDLYFGYKFNDLVAVRGGVFKAPFSKAALTSSSRLSLMERPEVASPFDAGHVLGLMVYGDFIKDRLSYAVNINNGSKEHLADIEGGGFDNRNGYYARIQYAGAGKISDFKDEADLRKDNRDLVWMLGGAVGYEEQNSSADAFPSPQKSTKISGLSSNNSPGFVAPLVLDGSLYRGTLDWSAKYRGWSILTAAYFQQINNTSAVAALTDTSGFQHAYYAQVGYMMIPQKLELVARGGVLLTEDGPNVGDFYALGANYYLFGQNAKLQTDITYVPEAAYTSSHGLLIQNSNEVIGRVQLQLKF